MYTVQIVRGGDWFSIGEFEHVTKAHQSAKQASLTANQISRIIDEGGEFENAAGDVYSVLPELVCTYRKGIRKDNEYRQ